MKGHTVSACIPQRKKKKKTKRKTEKELCFDKIGQISNRFTECYKILTIAKVMKRMK